jgi:hypothetical protein
MTVAFTGPGLVEPGGITAMVKLLPLTEVTAPSMLPAG